MELLGTLKLIAFSHYSQGCIKRRGHATQYLYRMYSGREQVGGYNWHQRLANKVGMISPARPKTLSIPFSECECKVKRWACCIEVPKAQCDCPALLVVHLFSYLHLQWKDIALVEESIPYSRIFSREKNFANFTNFCNYTKILFAKKGGRCILASVT